LLLGSWLNSQLPLEMIACHRLDANQSHHTLLQGRYSSSQHPTLAGPGICTILPPNFGELRHGEVRWVPGPMGENFSGSCTVTSRNLLIHIGATTATKSGCFDPKGVHQGLLSGGWRCVEESLATANFVEFGFSEVRPSLKCS